jgi:beta-phosphoglucomutase-like phosphatase (HAD superfamily)
MDKFLLGFGLAALIAVCIAGWQLYRQFEARVKSLEDSKRQAEDRARRLEEEAAALRHTENTISGVEDIAAQLTRVLIEEELQAGVRRAWIEQALRAAQILREGPRSYPVDPPSGNRVTYKVKINGNK